MLLSLLVITGLAGTLNNYSLSSAERRHATGLMKDSYKECLKTINGLTPAQFRFKSAPGSWSVADCFYHLVITERDLWSNLEHVMKSPANPEKRAGIRLTDDEIGVLLSDGIPGMKGFECPDRPKENLPSLDEAIAEFKKSRTSHIKYIKTSTEDMRNHVVQMPFGAIDCYQLCLLIALHSNRHIRQMNEIMNQAGFPAGSAEAKK